MADEVLARVHASTPRRVFGVAALTSLGLMLIYLAFAAPPQQFGYQIILLGVGAAALWLAVRMWMVTQVEIELTMEVLRLSDGTVLVPFDRITGIERGTFAFKPSQGFTLKLDGKMPGAWHPGMWWRLGKRLGVGGVTSGSQAKIMADVISAMMHERQPQ